jgi:HJR/Mrr/RecB family endonuclease
MNGTIFRKVRTETILKIYNTLVLPTCLYVSENWTLTALQRRRIEAAEIKLLRPLTGYTLHDHKTNDSVRRELQTECILDKIENTDGTGFYTCKECHQTESL